VRTHTPGSPIVIRSEGSRRFAGGGEGPDAARPQRAAQSLGPLDSPNVTRVGERSHRAPTARQHGAIVGEASYLEHIARMMPRTMGRRGRNRMATILGCANLPSDHYLSPLRRPSTGTILLADDLASAAGGPARGMRRSQVRRLHTTRPRPRDGSMPSPAKCPRAVARRRERSGIRQTALVHRYPKASVTIVEYAASRALCRPYSPRARAQGYRALCPHRARPRAARSDTDASLDLAIITWPPDASIVCGRRPACVPPR